LQETFIDLGIVQVVYGKLSVNQTALNDSRTVSSLRYFESSVLHVDYLYWS